MTVVTITIGVLMLVAGLCVGWVIGIESCAQKSDSWDDADWQEVQGDD